MALQGEPVRVGGIYASTNTHDLPKCVCGGWYACVYMCVGACMEICEHVRVCVCVCARACR